MSETTTLTLTDFLLARIAEDVTQAERAVRALKDFPGRIKPGSVSVSGVEVYDARRAVREIEAKRRIVELHRPEQGADVCDEWERWPCSTIRALAAVYADHPDCRSDWAENDERPA